MWSGGGIVSSLTKEYKSVAEIISPTWQTVVTDYSSRNFWTLASLYYGITWYLLLGESDPLACITKYVEARMVFDVHVQGFLFGSECSCRHLVNLGDAVCTLYVSSCLVELQQKLDITIAITTISLVRNDFVRAFNDIPSITNIVSFYGPKVMICDRYRYIYTELYLY